MANYATFSLSPNPYILWMINNLSLIITLNQEKKDLDEEISQNNMRTRNNSWHSDTNPRPNKVG